MHLAVDLRTPHFKARRRRTLRLSSWSQQDDRGQKRGPPLETLCATRPARALGARVDLLGPASSPLTDRAGYGGRSKGAGPLSIGFLPVRQPSFHRTFFDRKEDPSPAANPLSLLGNTTCKVVIVFASNDNNLCRCLAAESAVEPTRLLPVELQPFLFSPVPRSSSFLDAHGAGSVTCQVLGRMHPSRVGCLALHLATEPATRC